MFSDNTCQGMADSREEAVICVNIRCSDPAMTSALVVFKSPQSRVGTGLRLEL